MHKPMSMQHPADLASLEQLRQVALLEGLPEDIMREVARACRVRRFKRHQHVLTRDDVDRDCYWVLSGRLWVTAWSPVGREVGFRVLHSGSIFGEMSAIDGLPRSASVVALEASVLAQLNPESLEQLMQSHWPVAERMLRHLAHSSRQLTDRVYALSTQSVQQRLAAELMRRARGLNTATQTPVLLPASSHAELAGCIDTVRIQVLRELAELTRLSLVRRQGKGLEILNVQGLQRLIDS